MNNLSNRLSDTGDGAGALAKIGDAVAIRRRLAVTAPERFAPLLGYALEVLAYRLIEAGEQAGAIEALEGAITLVKPLAPQYPKAYAGRRYRGMLQFLDRLRGET